jgi:hypothetical protein
MMGVAAPIGRVRRIDIVAESAHSADDRIASARRPSLHTN